MLKTTSITKVKIRSKNTAHVHVHLYSFQGFFYHSNEAYFNEGQEHGKMCTAKIVWKYIHLQNFRMQIPNF